MSAGEWRLRPSASVTCETNQWLLPVLPETVGRFRKHQISSVPDVSLMFQSSRAPLSEPKEENNKMTVEGDKKEQELFAFHYFLNAYMIIFQIRLYPAC